MGMQGIGPLELMREFGQQLEMETNEKNKRLCRFKRPNY